MNTDLFKRVFLTMVVLRYDKFIKDKNEVEVESEEVVNAKREWTSDNGGKHKHVKKFLEDFEIINNEKDFAVSKVMETWLEKVIFGISYILFTKELKAYCINLHFDIVETELRNFVENHSVYGLVLKNVHIVQS